MTNFMEANFAHLPILPFSVFPLYAHTRLVKGYFLILHRQSGTLSLMKSGHPTPSHPSNHHLKLIFFSSPTDCVCVGGGTNGLSQSVRSPPPQTYFIACNGPCAPKEKWHGKEHIIMMKTLYAVMCRCRWKSTQAVGHYGGGVLVAEGRVTQMITYYSDVCCRGNNT